MIKEPKIIIWDLEIIPNLKAALQYWPQISSQWHSGQTLKADITSICCFGYKVYGTDEPARILNAWDYPGWEDNVNDDKKLCKDIHSILSTADAWVYQNGDWFDKRHLLTRLLIHKLPAMPTIPSIDTKKIAKKNFLLLANSLKHQAETFTKERKMDHQEKWQLWVDTHNKVKRAMKLMSKYCKQDVVTNEAIFKEQRPYIKNIPNYNLFDPTQKKTLCPSCGSSRLANWGWRYSKTKQYQRMKCKDCHSYCATPATKTLMRSI
jgi:hypothetical protein